MAEFRRPTELEVIIIRENDREEIRLLKRIARSLERIEAEIVPPPSPSPAGITFKETSMLPAVGGNTLVYTGTLSPAGAKMPGAAFSVSSSDPTVTATVDDTGLVVTVPLPTGFVDDPANPLTITWNASGISPIPSTSPTSLSATITPTIPTPSPTGVTFDQTT